MFQRSGHRHVLQVSPGGLGENFYRVLAVDSPPAVIHLDPITIQVYRDHPRLYRYLEEHYEVRFDLASACFFACHLSLVPRACEQASEQALLSDVDRLALETSKEAHSLNLQEVEGRVLQMLSLAPEHPEANYLMGRLAKANGDLKTAASHLAVSSRESGGHDLDALVHWAEVLHELGQTDRALSLTVSMDVYFLWVDGDWRAVRPWGLLFSRDPEALVDRYGQLRVRLEQRQD